jgi:glycerate kinase
MQAAAATGAKRCLIGIGGSATNDGGFGVARALGWQFLDRVGQPIREWTGLKALAEIIPPRRTRWFHELIVAADVRNPLLGGGGCTRVYGPQKGLAEKDFPLAEASLRRMASLLKKQTGRVHASEPGAGAAGGLGFGLAAFPGAQLRPGFEVFADTTGLEKQLKRADLVITGEGSLDESSFMGKGTGHIARRCAELKIPCMAIAGQLAAHRQTLFETEHSLTETAPVTQAQQRPEYWLEQVAARAATITSSRP